MWGWANAQSLVGMAGAVAVCWLLSEDRRRFPWRLAAGSLLVQVALVLLLFGFAPARRALGAIGWAVEALAGSSQAGTAFVFGYLAGGDQPFPVGATGAPYILGFRVIPVILVICALSALLWHWGVLKWITRGFGLVFQRTLGLRGAPALGTAATIFLGQVEGPIFIRAYLARLSRSELFTLMAVGLSCVSGSTMVAYATLLKGTLPNAAAHVLTASLISAPAGVLLARILIPPEPGEEEGAVDYGEGREYDSAMDALIRGVGVGLQVALNVTATLIVFVALVALCDRLLALAPPVAGAPISVQRVLGLAFTPLAWALGLPCREARTGGDLLGTKLVLTEFSAFLKLGATPAQALSERSRTIMTYAICGFANVASVGITAAGFTVLVPERKAQMLGMIWRALLAGFLATCMTGSLVGVMPQALFQIPAAAAAK